MNPLTGEELENPCVFRNATIARIWEYPYVYVKGHEDGDVHGPSDAIKQLAHAELKRLIPENSDHHVTFIKVCAQNTDKSDPMNHCGTYGWWSQVKTGREPDKVFYTPYGYPSDWVAHDWKVVKADKELRV